MTAQREKVHPSRQIGCHELARASRHKDLATVSGRADPRRPMDVHPDVARSLDDRLTGVECHTNLQTHACGQW